MSEQTRRQQAPAGQGVLTRSSSSSATHGSASRPAMAAQLDDGLPIRVRHAQTTASEHAVQATCAQPHMPRCQLARSFPAKAVQTKTLRKRKTRVPASGYRLDRLCCGVAIYTSPEGRQ